MKALLWHAEEQTSTQRHLQLDAGDDDAAETRQRVTARLAELLGDEAARNDAHGDAAGGLAPHPLVRPVLARGARPELSAGTLCAGPDMRGEGARHCEQVAELPSAHGTPPAVRCLIRRTGVVVEPRSPSATAFFAFLFVLAVRTRKQISAAQQISAC